MKQIPERTELKYPGVDVTIGGKTYVMPELAYGAYEDHDAFNKMINIAVSLEQVQTDPLHTKVSKDVFADIRELLYLALHRNYQELTMEFFKEILTFGSALLAVTQLIQKEGESNQILAEEMKKNVPKQPLEKKK